jgi:single-strand DNA-binding protein
MNDLNIVTVSGRAVASPTSIAAGKGFTFSIASNRSFKANGSEEFTEEVTFADCVAWSGLGAMIGRKLKKGNSVVVTGRLNQQRWEDSDSGEKRSRLTIVVTGIVGEFVYTRTGDQAPEPEAPPEVEPPAEAPKPQARRRRTAAAA